MPKSSSPFTGTRIRECVLAEPYGSRNEWAYVIGPFPNDDAAKAHAKKFRISEYSVRSVVTP